jgi:hypothetical protein
MKEILFTLICIMSLNMANAQNVNIPDANFKASLVSNAAINTNGDGEIQVTEAAAYNGYMYVVFLGIADLTGIEAFTALDSLACNSNTLTSLDVSSNTALVYLDCSVNPLSSLDVSANTALISLNCSINQLSSLDVSANTALTSLYCGGNQLTSLDVSANTALTTLECSYNSLTSLDVSANTALTSLNCLINQLTSLDVSSNTALTFLQCSENQLTSLNVSANTALTHIYCDQNQLTSLNVSADTALTYLDCTLNTITSLNVSANTALTYLDCSANYLTSLDVSANTDLTFFDCWHNQLTSLNVQNGNNSNIAQFIANNNPNLTCIQVDNVAYSNANWSAYKDVTASFSTDCGVTSVPDIDKLAAVKIIPNPASSNITIEGLQVNSEIRLSDMTGKILLTEKTGTAIANIDISQFPKGVYLLMTPKGTQKIVKF